MSNHYAPLPNPGPADHGMEVEMQAAFDYAEDDEDDLHNTTESRPLNPHFGPSSPLATRPHIPGAYDFESVDYDYPPPGSPPELSSSALPNNIGNSNGFIPAFNLDSSPGPRQIWFRRAAASLLPSHYLEHWPLNSRMPAGPVGGGTNNDGVFANVTAKPAAPVVLQDGDDAYLVPEDARREAPPSYASAQADAVPPYWETTVHAPFSPGSMGEMIVDSLPTGSLLSFCWNMLVSISFQFVGFLLTYLLHTSHAARLGSRAGLGVTLIQYGFALRGRLDNVDGNGGDGAWIEWKPHPTFASAADADAYYAAHGVNNSITVPSRTGVAADRASAIVGDATAEWLSFFLMTVGWFILLTSFLGFHRVKRWERSILASQRDSSRPIPISVNAPGVSRFEQTFGLRGISRIALLQRGFGFGNNRRASQSEAGDASQSASRAEQGASHLDAEETDGMLPLDPSNPRREEISQLLIQERRVQAALRDAGLL